MADESAIRNINVLKTDGGLTLVESNDGVGAEKAAVSTQFVVVLK